MPLQHRTNRNRELSNRKQVAAITVTYNRTKTLERCLAALCAQTRLPDRIIVVDNHSSEAERQQLEALAATDPKIEVLWLSENTGGAGGFEAGMRYVKENYAPDFYWIMDDDAYPRPDCLEQLLAALSEKPEAGCAAPLIYGIDLKAYQLYHHKQIDEKTLAELACVSSYEELPRLEQIDANAFVGPLFTRAAVDAVGIADGSLFIYGDDTEYTYRVSRRFPIYLVRDAVIDHQDPPLKANFMEPKAWWKEYYATRNKYFMLREFRPAGLPRLSAYARLTFLQLELIAAALLKPKYKGWHLLRADLLWRAVRDGLLNRRGKTLDPVRYLERFR